MPRKMFVWALLLSFSASLFSQTTSPKTISTPLSDVLPAALAKSSLTSPGSRPFHIKLQIRDVLDPNSQYQGEIEEYWNSPTLWKRIVTAPGLKQTITMNSSGEHYETSGDYFPQWLNMFVTAITNPVPDGIWSRPGISLNQRELGSGKLSSLCAGFEIRVSETVKTPTALCFFEDGTLESVSMPGYDMEFNEYGEFRGQRVAHLYVERIEGTLLVAKVAVLEPSSKLEDFFATPSDATSSNPLASIMLTASSLSRLVKTSITPKWPSVSAGMTTGNISAVVSADTKGQIREVTIVHSDNVQLNKAAQMQLMNMAWNPTLVRGSPLQVSTLLSLPFTTTSDRTHTLTRPPQFLTRAELSENVLYNPLPSYPVIALDRHIQGAVYMCIRVRNDGSVSKIGVIDSPSSLLTANAVDAVKKWKFRPLIIDGEPNEVISSVSLTFTKVHIP